MSTLTLTKKYPLRVTSAPAKYQPLQGSKYNLEVSLVGTADPMTGLLVQRDILDRVISENILANYDKCFLNDILEVPTTELLAQSILSQLKHSEIKDLLYSIELSQVDGTRFKIWAQK